MTTPVSGAEESSAGPRGAIRAALESELGEGQLQEPARLPPVVPDHTLLRRIGSGAYGDVWLARNALGSLRAVKVVYRDRFEEERPFQREFKGILNYEPLSRSHEGLVAVLHVGLNEESRYFYYVMEPADDAAAEAEALAPAKGLRPNATAGRPGAASAQALAVRYKPRTLRAEVANRRRLPAREAGQIVCRLAEALAHLHAHGLVHRDIKPSNVIFVAGKPKLADIGLIAGAGDSHSFVGTDGFIPPEGPGTPQADIYGLGKVLYELATGRDRLEFPQLPPGVPADPESEAVLELNEVMARACAPDPKQRYSTAGELAGDLSLFLSGRSLRQARQLERRVNSLRRVAIGACVCLLACLAVVIGARREQRRADQRAREARERAALESTLRHRAEAAESEVRRQLYGALLEQGRAKVRSRELGQRTEALEAVRKASAISNTVELRQVAMAALALPDLELERPLDLPADMKWARLDPDFKRVAMFHATGPCLVQSVGDKQALATLPPSGEWPSYGGRWSPDGKFLAIKRDVEDGGGRTVFEIWNSASWQRVRVIPDGSHWAVVFRPGTAQLLAGRHGAEAELVDLESGEKQGVFPLDGIPIMFAFAPGGDRFAAACEHQGGGGSICVYRVADGARLLQQIFTDDLSAVDWQPKGEWLAVSDYGGYVTALNATTGEHRVLGRHKTPAVIVAFTPDGRYFVSGGWERELICWDTQTLERAFGISLRSFEAQFRADGRLWSIAAESGVQLHRFEPPSARCEFAADLGGRWRRAVFSPDGRWLAVAAKRRVLVYDLERGGRPAIAENADAARLFFAPGRTELFASNDTQVFHWRITPADKAGGAPVLSATPIPRPDGYFSLCLGSNLVAVTAEQGTKLLSLDGLEHPAGQWKPTIRGVSEASADGRWLALFRPFTPEVFVYRLPGLEPVQVLTNHANVGQAGFPAEQGVLAVVTGRGLEVWDTDNWQRATEATNVIGALFSQTERGWWLARDYQSGGLYEAGSFKPLLLLPKGMLPIGLSGDGRQLAVSVDAERVQVWDIRELRARLRELGVDWQQGG